MEVPSAAAGNRSRVPMGIVRLGSTIVAVLVARYLGRMTATSWPRATSAFGNASTTSASPPVFENGNPSDATNRILILTPNSSTVMDALSSVKPASADTFVAISSAAATLVRS